MSHLILCFCLFVLMATLETYGRKFPGQGLNLSHRYNLRHSSCNARSLTLWFTRELPDTVLKEKKVINLFFVYIDHKCIKYMCWMLDQSPHSTFLIRGRPKILWDLGDTRVRQAERSWAIKGTVAESRQEVHRVRMGADQKGSAEVEINVIPK